MTNPTTLWCSIGKHEWERAGKRGRRPLNCPEHHPVKEVLDPEERIRRQQEGRRLKQEAKDKEGIAEVLAYRVWVKEDAVAWALYRSSEIDESEYRSRKPLMPKVPDPAAYKAARRAGVIEPDIEDEEEDSDESL